MRAIQLPARVQHAAAGRPAAAPAAPAAPARRCRAAGAAGGRGNGALREFERGMENHVPLQTRGKPERDAEANFNKREMLRAATTWQEAAGLFRELGENPDSRTAGLVAEMFKQAVTLMPGPVAELSPADAAAAAAALDDMLAAICAGINNLKGPAIKDVLYRLVDSGLSRPKAVAVLGIAMTGHIRYLQAGEALDAAAALALLQYRPPPAAAIAAAGDDEAPDIVQSVVNRSIRAFKYFTPKDTANAVFVFSRLAAPGSVGAEWLQGYVDASFDHLPQLQGEALALAGYMPARHGHLPDAEWRAAWIQLVGASADTLLGAEFPLVLFALARWQQLARAKRAAAAAGGGAAAAAPVPMGGGYGGGYDDGYGGGGGYDDYYGAPPPRAAAAGEQLPSEQLPAGWVDSLLLASHRTGALREMSVKQMASMLRALGALGAAPPAPWLARLWAAADARVSAAVRAGGARGAGAAAAAAAAAARPEDVAALLADWAALPAAGRGCPPLELADEMASYAEGALSKSLSRDQLARLGAALGGCGCGAAGGGGGAAGAVAARLVGAALASKPAPAPAAAAAAEAAPGKKAAPKPRVRRARKAAAE